MSKKIQIYKVKDNTEKYNIDKGKLFNMSFRLILLAKSNQGKTNLLVNLLSQDDKRLYKNDFDGDDIFIFSPSIKNDRKLQMLIKAKKIPDENLFEDYDPEVLDEIYKMVQDEYEKDIDEGDKPKHTLVVLDDLAFSGALKDSTKHSVVNKIFCNSRHINMSLICTAQAYVGSAGLTTCARENTTGIIAFKMSERQLDSFAKDHSYVNEKEFKKMFRKITNKPHSFFVVNYSNPHESMYMDSNFEPITIKDEKTSKKRAKKEEEGQD